jgi:hypothetical protein
LAMSLQTPSMTDAVGNRCVEGEGELLTVPKPRAVGFVSVCIAVKPVGKPDAGNRHVRFDERGWETGRWPKAPKLPRPSSTLPLADLKWQIYCVGFHG